ncbi:MAG: 1,4-beta-xylanase [Verrucomicrobiota bacterium]
MTTQWTPEQVWTWHRKLPWLVGCNFLPSTAINQLEMFQPDDYDRHREVLARELGWAAGLGMNSLRVFLHDLLWAGDRDGFCRRFDDFLDLCAERRIRPMIVFFDACHRSEPKLGIQPDPIPGLHNPGWAQSPTVGTLKNESDWPRLEHYITEVLKRHGTDDRILCWDLYNEPCNAGFDFDETKAPFCEKLVTEVFGWARSAAPSQPLTVCTWQSPDPQTEHDEAALTDYQRHVLATQRKALELSDIISFHNYGPSSALRMQIERLETLGRPLFCTEYMARTLHSRFEDSLPVLKKKNVAAYNWGFVSGKSQTIFPWGSPAGAPDPAIWFHDLLRPDGSAFDPNEMELIRKLTGA